MDDTLRTLQLSQLDILTVIDSFCRKAGIRYSLYAGTLLGAVRHGGFIPWDDDLDICMARSDYDRFISAWNDDPPEGYILQNKENTPGFTQSFTKIRKDHTAFLQYDWERGRYHTGIFVDVFPIDRIPSGKLARAVFQWRCLNYQLLTREFIPPKGSRAERAVSSMILQLTPESKRPARREQLLRHITARTDPRFDTVAIETMGTIRTPLPADLLDEFLYLPFEGRSFMCFKNWDGYLKAKFGDYMTPPPEKDRVWRHHPLILDFEHNLDEL